IAGLAEVGDHVGRAGRAARLLIALDRAGDGAATEELGLYGLLFSEVDREFVTQFIERNLGPVRDFDRTRGTSLLDTLDAWFAADGSPSATAERLFVHVNTVYQRLDRLDTVLGAGWRRGDRALELRLALRLAELRGA
ncbi:PucR family transcriptional regulator, partial [Dietzia kunjamensis]